MLITPSFKQSLIVEQFQGNYLKRPYCLLIDTEIWNEYTKIATEQKCLSPNKFSPYLHWGNWQAHFRCFHVFVTRCTTVITMGKGFFYMFVVNWDVVTTNGTNRTVIVPKASGTLNHRCYEHIPILTMITWFRGLSSNDSFLVRLAITFHVIAFRLTFPAVTTVATVAVIITFPSVLSINLFFFY